MKEKQSDQPKMSRRGLFTMLAGLTLAPFSGAAAEKQDEEFITVIKADGSTVKISKNVADKAKVVDARVSNRSMLNWIKKERP